MSDQKTAKTVFEKWAAELRNKDRSWNNILTNFDELFYELWKHSVPFDIAHELIKDAVAKHLPSNHVAKNAFNNLRNKSGTFQEFVADWKKGIEDFAIQAFYNSYKAEDSASKTEEKNYGGMSQQEYRKLIRYAESFPIIDWEKIQARERQGITDPEEYFKDILLNLEYEDGKAD